MSEINETTAPANDGGRREFLKRAGKVAVTLPAVALLLKASDAKAGGFNPYGKKHHKRGRALGHLIRRLNGNGHRH